MTATTGQEIEALDTDEAVRTVLRETLALLRSALEAVLGEDDGEAYGLIRGTDPA